MQRINFLTVMTPGLLLILTTANVARGQDDATNERAKEILKVRKSDSGQEIILARLGKEKSNVVLGLALGVHLDHTNGIDAKTSARVAARCLRKRDFFPQAMTNFATHSAMGKIVDVLMTQPTGEPIAATILAIYGKIYAMHEEANGSPPQGLPVDGNGEENNKAAKKAPLTGQPENVASHVKKLLENENEAIQELALLAAAYLRVKDATDQVQALIRRGSDQIHGAALLFFARTGQKLPRDSVRKALKPPRRADPRFTRLSPALSTYDVRLPAIGYACEAVGEARDETFLADIHLALENGDIRIQIEAARACERIGHESSVPYLLERLKNCTWPTKVYVLSALGAVPSVQSIEPLIKQLDKETGRFRLDVNYTLSSIFREQAASGASIWENHWAEVKDKFKPDRKATLEYRRRVKLHDIELNGVGSFYNLSIHSDSFIYVLDTSMSMKGARIASLKTHLQDSMKALAPHVRFNAITFGGRISMLSEKRMVTSQEGSLIAYSVENIELNPPTRTYDAVTVGCRFPTVDTVMFLSDGAPVSGHIERWSGIIAAYSYLNRYRPVAMYTIEFDAGRGNAQNMTEFANRNFGRSGSPDEVPEGAPEAD